MNNKPALAVAYLVSGGTAASGVVTDHGHIVMGVPISELALLVGIIGTLSTIALQLLSYLNTRAEIKARLARDSAHDAVEEKE